MAEELRGLDWLQSPENRLYELSIINKIHPFVVAGSLAARSAVWVLDSCPRTTTINERALVPGDVYRVEKIGSPGEGNPVSNLLARTMLDEVPQLLAVKKGTVALIGPRGTTPRYRERLFDSLDDGSVVDKWRKILKVQKHGLLSTYALDLHGTTNGAEYQDDHLSTEEIRAEAMRRYESDEYDFQNASAGHSQVLVGQFLKIVKRKMQGVISSHES